MLMTTTNNELPSLPDMNGLDFEELQSQLTGKFKFYFLEDFKNYTRYGIAYEESVTSGFREDDKNDLNENLPNAYVCSECNAIDSDISDYGCSQCGNGAIDD